jgi:hypothetical protein
MTAENTNVVGNNLFADIEWPHGDNYCAPPALPSSLFTLLTRTKPLLQSGESTAKKMQEKITVTPQSRMVLINSMHFDNVDSLQLRQVFEGRWKLRKRRFWSSKKNEWATELSEENDNNVDAGECRLYYNDRVGMRIILYSVDNCKVACCEGYAVGLRANRKRQRAQQNTRVEREKIQRTLEQCQCTLLQQQVAELSERVASLSQRLASLESNDGSTDPLDDLMNEHHQHSFDFVLSSGFYES